MRAPLFTMPLAWCIHTFNPKKNCINDSARIAAARCVLFMSIAHESLWLMTCMSFSPEYIRHKYVIYIYICVYTHICIYMYIHTHIYIYTHSCVRLIVVSVYILCCQAGFQNLVDFSTPDCFVVCLCLIRVGVLARACAYIWIGRIYMCMCIYYKYIHAKSS